MTYQVTNEEPKTRTNSSWARSPHSVQKWNNFIQNAKGMAVEDTTPRYDMPSFLNDMNSGTKGGVRKAIQNNVFDVLSRVKERQESMEGFGYSRGRGVQGNPALVFLGGDNLIFPIEVEMAWSLPDDNIVEIFDAKNPPVCVVNSIRQIYGYLAHNKRRYGVLSTYSKTWFMWRPENDPGALLISDVVNVVDTGPTLLRCFAYIMSLARQDFECSFPPPSPPRSLGDYHESSEENEDEYEDTIYQSAKGISRHFGNSGHGSDRANAGNNGIRSKRNQPNTMGKQGALGKTRLHRRELGLEMFDWDSFEVTELIGEGLSGRVFRGTLRGERVAIKLTDLWQYPQLHQALLGEAMVYVRLGNLQGHGIPKLKGVGYTAGGLFALIMELVGEPIDVEKLDDNMREMIVQVLASIHGQGFLHGDVRCDNILVEYGDGGPRITFIDFGLSRKFSSLKESVREMTVLRKTIRYPKKIRRLE
jgi:hypothetical protein